MICVELRYTALTMDPFLIFIVYVQKEPAIVVLPDIPHGYVNTITTI